MMASWIEQIRKSDLDDADYLAAAQDGDFLTEISRLVGGTDALEIRGPVRIYVWRTHMRDGADAGRGSSMRQGGGLRNRVAGLIGVDRMNWGHVAADLRHSADAVDDEPRLYMSYWPEEKVAGSCTFSLDEDIEYCGRAPDRVIEIENMYLGRMALTWYRQLGLDYNTTQRNCCTVLSRVLDEGFSPEELNARSVGVFVQRVLRLDQTIEAAVNDTLGDEAIWSPWGVEQKATYLAKLLGGGRRALPGADGSP